MSVGLTPVDLSALAAGQSAPLDWTGKIDQGGSVGVRKEKAHLRIQNESNFIFLVTLGAGTNTFHLTAGAWQDCELNGEQNLKAMVEGQLAGPSANLLLGTLYLPGEPVPPPPVLGNSAIGIGGQIATTTTSALKNDGNGPGTSIVEATPSDQASSSVSLNNDASGFLKVLSAGALRTLLNVVRGNSGSGHAAVDIGDAADQTMVTYHGRLDKLASDGGKLASDGSGNLTFVGNQATAGAPGVPVTTGLRKSVAVTTTGSATIITLLPTFDGLYRVNVYLRLNNSVSGQLITCQVFWTELDTGFATSQTLAVNVIPLDGSHSLGNGAYGLSCFPILLKAGLNDVHLVYNDPANVPNDRVSMALEWLG